eukprot:g22780.t1
MLATSSAVADAATAAGVHNEALTVGSSILLAALVGALALSLKKEKAQPHYKVLQHVIAQTFRNCSGQFLVLHRPTHDSRLDASGAYRYGDHFAGKKRLWELRFRFHFKLMDLSVAGMRQVVGDRLYHTLGDESGDGERERPAILLPLWAFDQFIETAEGETPPDLTDPNLPAYGHKRVGQIREYKRMIDGLDLRPGPTFTFCFWGVSRFCDVMLWQASGIPIFTPIDLNLYCGKPPLNLVLYTLKGDEEDKRHLQSRKTYYFRCCFWSSLKRPDKDVVMKLAGRSLDLLKRQPGVV